MLNKPDPKLVFDQAVAYCQRNDLPVTAGDEMTPDPDNPSSDVESFSAGYGLGFLEGWYAGRQAVYNEQLRALDEQLKRLREANLLNLKEETELKKDT